MGIRSNLIQLKEAPKQATTIAVAALLVAMLAMFIAIGASKHGS